MFVNILVVAFCVVYEVCSSLLHLLTLFACDVGVKSLIFPGEVRETECS